MEASETTGNPTSGTERESNPGAGNVIGTFGTARAYAGMDHHDNDDPFADLALDTAIHLRWTLRDIKAHRLTLSPVADDDLSLLAERGLVEVSDGVPTLTEAGLAAIN